MSRTKEPSRKVRVVHPFDDRAHGLARVGHAAVIVVVQTQDDPFALAVLKHYRSLMPMAQAARKPIFKLSAAEGAIGAHSQAVQQVGKEFRALGKNLLERSAPPA